MFRSCSSLVKTVSLTTVDRLVKRASVKRIHALSYDIHRLSTSPSPSRSAIELARAGTIRRFFAAASGREEERAGEGKSVNEEGGQAEASAQTSQKQMDELMASITKYKEQLAQVEDKYKRQLAETENVRQRFMRQVDEAKAFGIQNFCKDLLEIADVLELATESVPKEELSKSENVSLKQLYDGLVMTQTQLNKIFSKHGLVSVRPVGEKFNPNLHEAVFQVQDADKEAGSVANVVKIGYLLHDRLIRPAKVGVYIAP